MLFTRHFLTGLLSLLLASLVAEGAPTECSPETCHAAKYKRDLDSGLSAPISRIIRRTFTPPDPSANEYVLKQVDKLPSENLVFDANRDKASTFKFKPFWTEGKEDPSFQLGIKDMTGSGAWVRKNLQGFANQLKGENWDKGAKDPIFAYIPTTMLSEDDARSVTSSKQGHGSQMSDHGPSENFVEGKQEFPKVIKNIRAAISKVLPKADIAKTVLYKLLDRANKEVVTEKTPVPDATTLRTTAAGRVLFKYKEGSGVRTFFESRHVDAGHEDLTPADKGSAADKKGEGKGAAAEHHQAGESSGTKKEGKEEHHKSGGESSEDEKSSKKGSEAASKKHPKAASSESSATDGEKKGKGKGRKPPAGKKHKPATS
ncbi:hypothetical protein G7Y89_g3630 [Cudoniella acicularis]|uniref:Uncharacterized protein n=1 Tax=Cudoniella acicularis TaxID=354080 RepID=A0A8H4RS80_9HELO|nr:hypothetical protein G7Y89_g3630 [Cudoniella acicularis]